FIPRYPWNLPWHPGKVHFDCDFDQANGRYKSYYMHTAATWAPAEVKLTQPDDLTLQLDGFPDLETGLVYLTHPLTGFSYRRDGRLGTYRVWHDRLQVAPAKLVSADFGLLGRMGVVTLDEQQNPHSVLLEPI